MLEMCERSQIWRRQCTRGNVISAAYATPYRCNRQKYMIIVAIIISSVAILAQMVDRDTKKVTVRTQSIVAFLLLDEPSGLCGVRVLCIG